jgi:pseudaminic acid synthase
MKNEIKIGSKIIGQNSPVFIIAEMSANHLQDFDRAVKIIKAAKEAGADAVKLQTYTPDTITIDCDNEYFQIAQGTIWDGTTLHKLIEEAYTPWDWQPKA